METSITKQQLFSKEDLKKLIIPLLFEQALAITVGMADTVMISSAGEAAVSGVSLIDMFNNLIISVLAALATGGAVVTSQFLGAGKKEDACKSAKQLIVSSVCITIGISILVMVFCNGIISLFFGKIEADVFHNAVIYMMISALSFPFLALYNSCAALFRSMGNSQITLKVSVVENIINIGGNALGVYVLGLGVAGVAIPSLISRAVAGFILYRLLKNPSNEVHLLKESFHIDWPVIHKIFYIGIPSGIENGIFQLGRVIVVSIIAGFGTVQIAANGVYCGTGYESGNDHGNWPLCRCRRFRSGAVLYEKIIEDYLLVYLYGKQRHPAVSVVDPEMLWIKSGDHAVILYSGHDPQRYGDVFVAGVFCSAEYASCLQ